MMGPLGAIRRCGECALRWKIQLEHEYGGSHQVQDKGRNDVIQIVDEREGLILKRCSAGR